jgi:N-acyl-D-amino-acid deacylase
MFGSPAKVGPASDLRQINYFLMKTNRTIILLLVIFWGCSAPEKYDVLIKNGQIFDGSGLAPFTGDIGINADTIVKIGSLKNERGRLEIDAKGLAVAPGFINMLSWANESLIADGRSQSDIRQGVTLEVLGEGESMGPLNNKMKKELIRQQTDIKYDINWKSLGEYLDYLEKKGVSPNIASFVGAATLRIYTIGYEDRSPTGIELDSMKLLLRQAMEEGALGISSALIYAPGSFAKTDELIALCKEAAKYDGIYISHIRNEGNRLLESIDEWAKRLQNPLIREKVIQDMRNPAGDWENYLKSAGSAENILLVGFKNDTLKYLTGKTLAEVAKMRKKSPEETAMDLVIQDGSRVGTVYFLMSEDNVRKQIALPWISLGSDEGSYAPEGVFLKSSCHPRAYGNFARLLGKYVREEKIISLEKAIYKLTALPATNLKIKKRGAIKAGYYADLAIFDPVRIQDHATFENPRQYSTGMVDVFVNGIQVLKDGEHTGELPGRVIRGPGWKFNKTKINVL